MPSGIPYIVSNEAAERFSYYGMKTILAIFMTEYLLMSETKATIWQHTFVMAAYFLPLLGAMLSDIWLGKYRTIMYLSLFYCLGHLVLAIWETQAGLAAGLGLIALGSGGIKPNVSSHVGDQFTQKNSHLIERVFGYFYLAINIGSLISTLLTPLLLKYYGPHVAFGVPGLLMLVATFVFWLGRNKFVAVPAKGWQQYKKEVFTAKTGRIVAKLGLVYLFVSFFWSLYDQTMTTWVLQAKRAAMVKTIDLGFWQFELLPDQVQAVNPFLILVLTPLFSFVVYPLVSRVYKLTAMRKIAIGLFITAFSFVVIGWVEGRLEAGHTMHISWQFLAYFIITAAEVMVSITALEFSYTQAPIAIKSFVMALFWATITVGSFITVVVNEAIVEPIAITRIETGAQTYLYTDNIAAVHNNHKIGMEELPGVRVETILRVGGEEGYSVDTEPLSGTYVIANVDESTGRFQLLDIDYHPVVSGLVGDVVPDLSNFTAQVNRFSGASYYYSFAVMMLVGAALFLFVARGYKEEHFIHTDREEAEALGAEFK